MVEYIYILNRQYKSYTPFGIKNIICRYQYGSISKTGHDKYKFMRCDFFIIYWKGKTIRIFTIKYTIARIYVGIKLIYTKHIYL